ncbi:MAG: hypothetical protein KC444_08395, partial [Nitrosopumilus sp.]|nr:hypothetical protein [Nitrosopumilus sp.]
KIYSQVLEKSKEDSVETRKEFANLWLENIDIENNSSFLEVKDDYNTFLNSSNPSVTDFENFEASLNQKLYRKSIHFLDSYGDSLKGFFDTWKYMWKNKP